MRAASSATSTTRRSTTRTSRRCSYVVTDGATFTDVQGRDTTYTVAPLPGGGGMGCTVTTTANSGKYQIATDYITDPARNALLMKVSFKAKAPSLRLYLRFDPTVNGNGGGGGGNGGADSALTDTSTGHPILVSDDPVTATNAANRDYAQPVYLALDAPFTSEITTGFAGSASDGLVELDAAHALTTSYAAANNGNVVQTARIAGDKTIQFTAALGFGSTQSAAVSTAESALGAGWGAATDAFKQGWQAYDAGLNRPPSTLPGIPGQRVAQLRNEYYTSANVLKAVEDKTFPGALVAAPASPWGQAISAGDPQNTYFGSYREVFARDLYEIWTGLMADGDTATAKDATLFLFDRQQQPDGSMPRNSLVNGKLAPDSFGDAARRDRLPAADGGRAAPHRPRSLRAAHQARRELRRGARPGVRRRALGGAERLLALDDRGGDRRPRRGRRPRGREQ